MQSNVKLGSGTFGNSLKLSLIAGPCVLESHSHARKMVEKLLNINEKLNVNFIYKTSFDKANRTSLSGVRGLGLDESLKIFSELKNEYKIKLLTDVHTEDQCSLVSEYVDIIQIPAFLCRQTDLLISAAKTNKVINVKKGQFLAPWDMKNVVKKIESSDNTNILITERGTSFGYNTLISDMRSLDIMKDELSYPIIFDATHSVQSPGGQGDKSGGDRKFVPTLAKAAVSAGIAGVFIETHDDPDNAPSDGPNMLHIDDLEKLVSKLLEIDNVVKEY
ncbi:3-deoxy-8-phosphooctulonate synthase [Pelagibacteraceae bacterium]|jgi:2-dehydro-3-deoxyphosphooctonate aldolase (KDO 8-P synthase)|nr:3-deoxy-8-phosphooctulonate synthase [Pelagibacteraceae bacterium]